MIGAASLCFDINEPTPRLTKGWAISPPEKESRPRIGKKLV